MQFEAKRFAIGALAARIHEELVLWCRLSKLLNAMEKREIEAEDFDEYNLLSKKSEALTYLIVKSVKELEIKNKKSVKDIVENIQDGWFSDNHETENGTTSDND